MHGISFTAIDFETANSHRASWLIKPPSGHDRFHPINVGVHGITAG
ncbi:hypothetical protein ACFUCV_03075 [Specibacter sp. NPDC057265]